MRPMKMVFSTNLHRVVRIWTDDRMNRIAGVYYEPVVGWTMHVLRIVGNRMQRIWHRQPWQLRVQITVGVLL